MADDETFTRGQRQKHIRVDQKGVFGIIDKKKYMISIFFFFIENKILHFITIVNTIYVTVKYFY